MKTFLKLLRAHQWYKNVVIFLPLFFTRQLFNLDAIYASVIGFVALCLVSSVNYIINDLVDMKKDRLHPIKKKRPLASGAVSPLLAVLVALAILGLGMYISLSQSFAFAVCAVLLIIFTQVYTFWLKNVPFADILMISINFVLRATSGMFLIHSAFSPWLILCPFFLALFLAIAKRDANVRHLKKNAYKYRPVLQYYSLEITNALMIITTTCLVISYALYAFLNNEQVSLLLTLPFAFYVIFRYFYLVYSGSDIPADPHKALKDTPLVIGVLLWGLAALVLLYAPGILAGIL